MSAHNIDLTDYCNVSQHYTNVTMIISILFSVLSIQLARFKYKTGPQKKSQTFTAFQKNRSVTICWWLNDLRLTQEQREETELHLAAEGHKASLSKLQFVQQMVVFWGHVIIAEGKSFSPKRIEEIQNIPKPVTKKQVLSFWICALTAGLLSPVMQCWKLHLVQLCMGIGYSHIIRLHGHQKRPRLSVTWK